MRRKKEASTSRGRGVSDRELKLAKGSAGKALLMYLQSLSQKKLAQMEAAIARRKDERSSIQWSSPKQEQPQKDFLRTRFGYVYR